MQNITTISKLKWGTPDDPTKFELHYPPAQSPRKLYEFDSWVGAMMMDTRLTSSERCILIAIAQHYNLKDGLCCPLHARVGVKAGLGYGDTAVRAVQRAVAKAVKLGWLKRTFRYGGRPGHNQSNLYDLTLPRSIQDVLANRGPALKVAGGPGAREVVQVSDGIAICGPFKGKTPANPEWWVERAGALILLTNPRSRGQTGTTEGTWDDSRGDISTPHNMEQVTGNPIT